MVTLTTTNLAELNRIYLSDTEMSEGSSGKVHGVEAHATRALLRLVILVLHARHVLISRAPKADKSSAELPSNSGEHDLEETTSSTILTTSPQVSLDDGVDGGDDQICNNRQCQYANIAKIVKEKDMQSLHEFGGKLRIAEALDSDLENGIPESDIEGNADAFFRRRVSTVSKTEIPPNRGFFKLLLKSGNNYVIFLLLSSAILSIGFGIMEEGARTGWYEGFVTIVAVIIIVLGPAIRDLGNDKKFLEKQKLSKNDKEITAAVVVRGGREHNISISDIVLGDIVCLKRGRQIPADGLFVSGKFLQLNDSLGTIIDDQNPFVFYGAMVIDGEGRMLVTSVGVNTVWEETMSRINHDAPNKTPLQAQLDKVSTGTQILGLITYVLILVVLFLRFKFDKEDHNSGLPELKGKQPSPIEELVEAIQRIVIKHGKINTLTASLSIPLVMVGLAEGLLFVITLSIIYWNWKTLSHKALAKKLSACVTMGTITTILTDKTGGLTLDSVKVDMCFIGEDAISEDSEIGPDVLDALCDGINFTHLIMQNPSSTSTSTDDPLLSWASLKLGKKKMEISKQRCTIVESKQVHSNIDELEAGVLIRKTGENEADMCLYRKGSATTILSMCSRYYDINGSTSVINEDKEQTFKKIIAQMQSKTRTAIALACKQTKQTDLQKLEESNLILIGLLGLKQTCWEEARNALEECTKAGVKIKLVSEDEALVLEDIANKCGMFDPDSGTVPFIEGKFLETCITNKERMETVDKIVGMGNSLPSDRLLLVNCLKQKGHIVAVVGFRTTESPALEAADVGIAMGTWSSKTARDSSDIIIWDEDFRFLLTVIRSGRCIYENIRKYIQLELTMIIAGFLITSITTISSGDASISTIQLIWGNLIVTVLGGFALLTEPPTQALMERPPVNPTEALITKVMWRNIVTQASYQAAILVIFLHQGQPFLGFNHKVIECMIFNSFIFCQVFNQFNAREPEKINVFEGLHWNHCCWVAAAITVVLQEAFIEIASIVSDSARLNSKQWAACILIAMASWALNCMVNCGINLTMKHWATIFARTTQSAPTEATPSIEIVVC